MLLTNNLVDPTTPVLRGSKVYDSSLPVGPGATRFQFPDSRPSAGFRIIFPALDNGYLENFIMQTFLIADNASLWVIMDGECMEKWNRTTGS
jgi:hypothetical protein